MANNAFLKAIYEKDYCCPWGFFRQYNLLSAWELALLLDISERTAKTWRRKYRTKQMKCVDPKSYCCVKVHLLRTHV